jgi:hypothetical protein
MHLEIDEHEHAESSGYTQEESRIVNMTKEFPNKQYIVIRINPHGYKSPRPYTRHPSKKKRMKLLVDVMKKASTWQNSDPLHTIYMFYSHDNPQLCKNSSRTMLYDEDDVSQFCAS